MKEFITPLIQDHADRPLSGQVLNVVSSSSVSITNSISTRASYSQEKWSDPKRKSINIYDDRIEMIYTQYSTYYYSPSPPSERRIFKIVYSCVDGKWNVSEPIYGKIIPATKETYEFED